MDLSVPSLRFKMIIYHLFIQLINFLLNARNWRIEEENNKSDLFQIHFFYLVCSHRVYLNIQL